MKKKIIILAGSGHSHLEVVKALSKEEIAAHRFLLISPYRQTYYSGLVPRFITGEIAASELTINSADYAEEKGFYFIQDSVQSINEEESFVSLASGKKEPFDFLSLNVGGVAKKIPSESSDNIAYLRPFDDFMVSWRKVQSICAACVSPRFVVIGGGAAAVEVATALRIKLNKELAGGGEVHLVTSGRRLCTGYSEPISKSISRSLLDFNVQVHFNEPVRQILANKLSLSCGETLEFDFIFVVTPTMPSEMTSRKTNSKLQISSKIFAVGDGAAMEDHPNLPRSGVIAVHQGRHLVQSIRNILENKTLQDFKAPSKQINILISGESSARIIRGGFNFEGRWPLQVKNWIDQRYMKSFV